MSKKILRHEKSISAADLMPNNRKDLIVLNHRATQLAKTKTQKTEKNNLIMFIKFKLGPNESFGVPYRDVKEVIHHFALTKIPCTPNYIAGVINRHGNLLAILDLKKFLLIPGHEIDEIKSPYIIILSGENMSIGILTDSLDGSDYYDPATLDAPFSSGVKAEYIIGLHHGITAIFQVEALLSSVASTLKVK